MAKELNSGLHVALQEPKTSVQQVQHSYTTTMLNSNEGTENIEGPSTTSCDLSHILKKRQWKVIPHC